MSQLTLAKKEVKSELNEILGTACQRAREDPTDPNNSQLRDPMALFHSSRTRF